MLPMISGSKKWLHKHYIQDVCIEVSQSQHWRQVLFKARFFDRYSIDSEHREGITPYLDRILLRYDLHYCVSRVPFQEARNLSDFEGYTIFRFEATRYPDIHTFSANNPASV
jgi:hypothetical protein